MLRVPFRFVCVLLFSALPGLRASSFVWIGAPTPTGNDVADPANWSGGAVPGANADLVFGNAQRFDVLLVGSMDVNTLTFSGSNFLPYHFEGPATLNLQNGLSTIVDGAADVSFGANVSLVLGAAQTWDIGSDDWVSVDGTITSVPRLTKAGTGTLYLSSAAGLTGGVTITGGALQLGANYGAGNGTLIIQNGGALASVGYPGVTIASAVTLENGAALGFDNSSNPGPSKTRLTFTGTVTAADPAATVLVRDSSENFFEGPFTAAVANTDVTFTGGGVAIFMGSTGANIRDFIADDASLYFDAPASLPTGNISSLNSGYIGMGSGFTADPGLLTAKITNKAGFSGTLGFDTDNRTPSAPNAFHGTIDVSGFGANFIGLGSGTHATIESDATLNFGAGVNYKFGGGGGRLTIRPDLTAAVGLSVVSPSSDPLTLVLTGNNTFTGNVDVANSYLIFDSPNAFPFAASQKITLGASAYVGSSDTWTHTPAELLSIIDASTVSSTAIVGFDSSLPATNARDLGSTPIDFTANFGGASALPYLGTTTFGGSGLTVDGPVTVPAGKVLKLTGLNNGRLNITSDLLATNNISSVVIGHPDLKMARGGTVVLSGTNNYAGGTTLQSGTLVIDGTSPIGAGALTVDTHTTAPEFNIATLLPPEDTSVSLLNDIMLQADAYLQVGSPLQSTGEIIFQGNLSGAGTLQFIGPVEATIQGGSTRTGNTYINNTTVNVSTTTGLKSGSLFLENGSVFFAAATPVIGSLGSNAGGSSSLNVTSVGATLEISQSSENKYAGTFAGTGLNLLKTGFATLWLVDANKSIGGNLTVDGGTINLAGGNTFSFSNNNAYVGLTAAKSGAITVSRGSTWSTTGEVKIGVAGTAALEVFDGGMVQASNFYIGYEAGSVGGVLVSGLGSALSATNLELSTGGGTAGLTVEEQGSVTVTNQIKLLGANAVLKIGDGGAAGSLSASSIANAGSVIFDHTNDVTFNVPISGIGTLVKTGSGKVTLGVATNTFGALVINDGNVVASVSGALGSPMVMMDGGRLVASSGVTIGNPLQFAATPNFKLLSGNGAFSDSTLTLSSHGGIAPGQSIGMLTFNTGLTWGTDSVYEFEVQDALGSPGSGYDSINVTGTLAFSATIGQPLTIYLKSLTAGGAAGNVANFVASDSYNWQIASASTLAGFGSPGPFASAAIIVDTTGFTNMSGGIFSVSTSTDAVFLNYTPAAIPEPSTWALLMTGLAIVGVGAVRRRRRA